MRLPTPLIYIVLVLISLAACKTDTKSKKEAKLGDISFEVTANTSATEKFEEGMLLLHSFQYKDAAEKFQEAQNADPEFGMAYWGEAMTLNHPLWREQKKDDAIEILQKLGNSPEERIAKIGSPFEKDIFKGAELLFFGDDVKNDRDIKYRDHLAGLCKKYPDNHEVAAQYALSILGAVKEGRDNEAYEKGARIAQGIIAENPDHPGALHYLIHSYDDPKNAPKALEAANRYSKVAPDANHALHMPSHIYVAMGMWDDVISSNKAAFAASVKRKDRKDLDNDALDYHSLKWLMYGQLQKERFEEARGLVVDMEKYCAELPSKKALAHLVMMKGAYFSESQNWADTLSLDTFDYSNLAVQIMGVHCYNNAMVAFENKNEEEIRKQSETLAMSIAEAEKKVMAGGASMCSGNYNRSMPTQLHIERATVLKHEIDALIALLNKDETQFEKLMQLATTLEEETSYMYGPPEIVKPSSEMYGEWLLQKGRKEEAKKHFEIVIERAPKRLLAMKGLEQTSDNI